jgi:subtilisin family serine protease
MLAILAGTVGTANHALGQGVVPDDPAFVRQWGLGVTSADLAWNITTGSTEITVTVIDSGIDYTHPDLYLNVWVNQEEIPPEIYALLIDVDDDGLITFWDLNKPANQGPDKITDLNGNGYIDGGDLLRPMAEGGWADGLDNGDNGYVDDLIGWDFFDNDNDPADTHGHGTAVAGIIGAVGDNGVGVTGINWKCQMMPLRNQAVNGAAIFNTPGGLEKVLLATVEAFAYSLDNGTRVINISGSAPAALVPPDLIAATDAAIDAAAECDVLVVVAAGNEGLDTDLVPYLQSATPHDNVIVVAATFRQQDRLAFFGDFWASNYGAATVDLGSPGDYLWTTEPDNFPGEPYRPFGGTSGATPLVTGAAALILSVNPDLTYAEVKSLLLDSVDPTEELLGTTVSGGRLNIANSVLGAMLP